MGRVVQILGTAGNVGLTPDVPGAERWCSNNPRVYRIRFPQAMKTYTRWFNMHSHRHITTTYPSGYKWYQNQDGTRPIYLRDAVDPTIPGSVVFPGPLLMDYFANQGQQERFFTFSGSWFVALVTYEHLEVAPVERVELWGIEMKRDRQWDHERPAMHYWMGRAEVAGIHFLIPEGVNLCRDRVGQSDIAARLRTAENTGAAVDLRDAVITREDPQEFETIHYLIGRCRQHGIPVLLPEGICVAPKLYGYETT